MRDRALCQPPALPVACLWSDSTHRLARPEPGPKGLRRAHQTPRQKFPVPWPSSQRISSCQPIAIPALETRKQFSYLPAQQRSAPGKATTDAFQQQHLTVQNAAILDRFIQRKRDGCSRCIAVMMYGYDDLLLRQSELTCSRLHDSDICLVRNEPVNIGNFQTRSLQNFICTFFKNANCEFKYRTPVHVHERRTPYFSTVYAARYT